MKPDDVAMQHAVARYADRNRAGTLSVVVTIALVIAQAALVYVAMMLTLVFGMSTDSCAYQQCGDENWVRWAIFVAFPLGVAVFLASAAFAGFRLVCRKRAVWIPSVGCIAQLLLMVAGWVLAAQAGPIH